MTVTAIIICVLRQVEAIGDAYMVVSGTPDMLLSHAERIANTALGMLICCRDLRSPYDYGDRSKTVKVQFNDYAEVNGTYTGRLTYNLGAFTTADIYRFLQSVRTIRTSLSELVF